MTRRLAVVAAMLLCMLATPALASSHHGRHHQHRHTMQHHHAKQAHAHKHYRHHRHHASHRKHAERQATAEAHGWFNSLVSAARSSIGETARQLGVRRSLWCMAAVNKWLGQTGHRQSGSDLAKSALALGPHSSAPQVGSLAVMNRRGGGHVGVVSGVTENGDPIVISGNHGRTVAEAVYPRSRIIAYVIPE